MTAAERFRPVAVPFADTAAQAWRAALLAQRAADPDHGDFYDLAAHVVDTLRALDGFVGVLAGQVAEYDAGRAVYDDEGSDPHCRLRSAVLALAEARQPLAEADQAMNRFWSAIGHIGTRYPGSPS